MNHEFNQDFENDQYLKGERFLEFILSDRQYAIPLMMVQEVISAPVLVPIPRAPAHFLGLMNLRGQIITVFDLSKKLGIISKNDNEIERVAIIVNLEEIQVGFLVDSINRVFDFNKNNISKASEIKSQVNINFVEGICKNESSLTIILDLNKVLDLKIGLAA